MRRILMALMVAPLALPAMAADAHAGTVAEVKKAIADDLAHTRKTGQSPTDEISKEGSLEFWSSGGLLQRASAGTEPRPWESFNLHPKHIEVISLVEDRAAVAMYYLEGSMQPKGYPAVPHYLARVTVVYVKEEGKWKRRAAHWSAVGGGGGTSQSAE